MSKIGKRQLIEMGVLISLILLVVEHFFEFILFWWLVPAILLITLVIPIIFKPIAFLWFGLAEILNKIVQPALLSLVYFLVICPVGLIRKFMGKDNLQLREFKKSESSVFRERNHQFTFQDLKRLF